MTFSLAACSALNLIAPGDLPDPTRQAEEDALAIYQVMLTDIYPDQQPYIIDRQTRSYQEDFAFAVVQELLPGLQPTTAQNFEDLAGASRDLGSILGNAIVDYELIDPDEYFVDNAGEIPEQCGWTLLRCFDAEKFRSDFPASDGFIQLSNIGFNQRHSQALAAVELRDGSGSGSIYLVLLANQKGKWVIQDTYERFWTA